MQVQERSLPVSIISVPSRYKAGMCSNPGPKRASRINQEFFLLSSDGVLPSFTPSHSRQPLPLNHSWLRKWNLFNFLPMSVLVASLSCIYIKCSLLFKQEPSHLLPLLLSIPSFLPLCILKLCFGVHTHSSLLLVNKLMWL